MLVQNFFHQSPRENMIAAIVCFYSASEIGAAKTLIFGVIDVMRPVTSRQTYNIRMGQTSVNLTLRTR